MNKVISDIQYSLDIALFWALNAKMFQTQVSHRFNLSQEDLPIFNNVPALSMKPSSELLQDDLNALHSRRAFITSGNDKKLKEHYAIINVRKSGEVKYLTGDIVFYKREDKNG